jgi:hypothetical protein
MESAEFSHVLSNRISALFCGCPKLHMACTELMAKVSDEDLDLVTWWRIQGMLGLLNLYLDEGLNLSWKKASVVVSKAQGRGDSHAQLGFRMVTGLPAVFRLRFSRLRLQFLILTPAGKPYPYLRCHGTRVPHGYSTGRAR